MNEDEDGEEEVTDEDEMDEDEGVPYSDEIEGEEEEEDEEEDHFAGQANGIKSRVNGYAKAAAEDSRGSLCCIRNLNGKKKEADLVGFNCSR